MENEDQMVVEWVEGNYSLIMDIYLPLAHNENALLRNYDNVFHDEIRKNFKDLFYGLLSIEFGRATGLSSEAFYTVFDEKTMDNLIYKLEDYDLSDYYK
jgi:hypothetical protein